MSEKSKGHVDWYGGKEYGWITAEGRKEPIHFELSDMKDGSNQRPYKGEDLEFNITEKEIDGKTKYEAKNITRVNSQVPIFGKVTHFDEKKGIGFIEAEGRKKSFYFKSYDLPAPDDEDTLWKVFKFIPVDSPEKQNDDVANMSVPTEARGTIKDYDWEKGKGKGFIILEDNKTKLSVSGNDIDVKKISNFRLGSCI